MCGRYYIEIDDDELNSIIAAVERNTSVKTGESLFVVLTRPAWSGISFIHDRMPVILPKSCHDEWLNGRNPVRTMCTAIDKVHFKVV